MESDSEAPDDSVFDPDYSLACSTEEDDDYDVDDDSPEEVTSSKRKKTSGVKGGGRGSHGRGKKGRGRGFPQGENTPKTTGQQVVEAEQSTRGGTPAAARRRPGRSRGSQGRSSRGRGGTRGGVVASDGERPGTSTDVPGGSSRGRGVSRAKRPRKARGRQGRGHDFLTQDDLLRVQQFQEERIAAEEARVQALDLTQSRELNMICLRRDPSMLFDLVAHTRVQDASQIIPIPGQPAWCVCGRCRQMPRDVEKVCCQQTLENCISVLPHMDAFILQPGILRLARRIWNDSRALHDAQDPGESHKQFRFAAYRQYVIWQYGQLGQGHRVIIPSCCVWRIRDEYPDPNGMYKGFIPSRYGGDEY